MAVTCKNRIHWSLVSIENFTEQSSMARKTEFKIRAPVTNALNMTATLNRKLKNPFHRHLFLTDIHEPMTSELSLDHLKVSGQIPEALVGTYARISPNPFKSDPRGHHWFVGDGMVHGIRLSGGKATWYHNRYIRASTLERNGGPPAAAGPDVVHAIQSI